MIIRHVFALGHELGSQGGWNRVRLGWTVPQLTSQLQQDVWATASGAGLNAPVRIWTRDEIERRLRATHPGTPSLQISRAYDQVLASGLLIELPDGGPLAERFLRSYRMLALMAPDDLEQDLLPLRAGNQLRARLGPRLAVLWMLGGVAPTLWDCLEWFCDPSRTYYDGTEPINWRDPASRMGHFLGELQALGHTGAVRFDILTGPRQAAGYPPGW